MNGTRDAMALGYAARIKELVAEMMRGEFVDEETFVDRAADVMSAMSYELANCAAALTVQQGAEPGDVARVVGNQFSRFFADRLDTLQGENAATIN